MARVHIVVPCFDEADRLPVDDFLAHDDADVSFLFVDDGSGDATWEVLGALCARRVDKFFRIRLRQNQGKAEAVRFGMREALDRGATYVGYWDADLATPLEEIHHFVARLDADPDLDVVIGSRVRLLGRTIERRTYRHLYGRVFATAVSQLLQLGVYDTQCGAKLFRDSDDLRAVLQEPFTTRWVFDVELLARLISRWEPRGVDTESRIYEWPLRVWRDVAGSKIHARDAAVAFMDLARIAQRYRAGLALRYRR